MSEGYWTKSKVRQWSEEMFRQYPEMKEVGIMPRSPDAVGGGPLWEPHDRPPSNLLAPPEIVIQATVIEVSGKTTTGDLVAACSVPWSGIVREIARDPSFVFNFAKHPRQFEQFIAAAYDKAGFDEIVLTPQRGDGGRDVIATKHGFGSIRILEQAKAYSPGHLVNHDDMRAMLGVLQTDPNSSKGIITTTSDFQPGILNGPEFKPFMPYRLETKNGQQLLEWLKEIENEKEG